MRPPREGEDRRERARRAYRLFSELLELPPGARSARLEALDETLRAEVETLLEADNEATGLLDGRAADIAFEGALGDGAFGDNAFAGNTLDSQAETLPRHAPGESEPEPEPGAQVGGYRLERELGRGGMGRVFAARRADGTLDREVAIKIIEGSGRPDAERAFLAEGRALASLSHPHVARVFDAGVEPCRRRRYYLVMELIDGVPVTDFAAPLELEERIALFLDVCDAVAAAHRQRLVHRDIKPSNILVDASGQAKLLDFGIAVSLDRAWKRSAHLRFTPAYAAPEQLRGEEITPATDVYALGLLLYELLTSQPAVDIESIGPAEMVRRICDEDPPPPSMAFGTSLPDPRTPTGRLRRRLRGDLDTIVMKALRKAPAERYRTVAALAEDLRRWRDGRPIEARPIGLFERGVKLLRRRPRAATAATFVLLALTFSSLVMDAERRRAERARAEAEVEKEKAERVAEMVRWLFEASQPSEALGVDAPALELLASGVERAREAESPAAEAEMLRVLARAYRQLGEARRAEALEAEALERREAGMTWLE